MVSIVTETVQDDEIKAVSNSHANWIFATKESGLAW
jgi:hypothetical protein